MIISDKTRDNLELVLAACGLSGLLPAVVFGLGWAMFGEAFYEVGAIICLIALGVAWLLLLWSCVDDIKAGRF